MESSVALPFLVIDHDGAGGEPRTTLLDISKGDYQYHTCNDVDVLRNRRRWVTPHGWVLSWDPSTFCTFLWSPQSLEKIELPSLTQEIPMYSECSLSDKPTATGTTGFTVVVVEPEDTVIWYCRVGGKVAAGSGWVRHEYDLGSDMIPGISGMMHVKRPITRLTATTGGRFYFIKFMDELGVLEFSPEPVITSVKVPSVKRPRGMTSMAPCCVELDGDLYLVTAFLHSDVGVETSVLGCGVYRMDFAGRRWRKVRSVGDRAFLMCPSYFGGWCAATASGLRPNSVYWMAPCHNLNLLHVFDVAGSTVEVHDPFKGVHGLNCNAMWMLPQGRS